MLRALEERRPPNERSQNLIAPERIFFLYDGVRILRNGVLVLLLSYEAHAEESQQRESGDDCSFSDFLPRHFPKFFDPEDGQFDLSKTLDQPHGFFPLVIPITEPAVGAGAAFLPIFIDLPEDGKGRPNIWAAGGMATSNGSEAYLAGYSGYFQEDKWHVLAGAVDASINLNFYGLGGIASEHQLQYNLDMTGGLLGFDRKIGHTDWRAGMRYLYSEISPSLVRSSDHLLANSPEFLRHFGPLDLSSTISSLQGTLTYDSRDNIFTPTRGIFSELTATANLTALGGSDNYQLLGWSGIWYQPIVENHLYWGWRADLNQSFGDIPFYLRPSLQLRGAPVMRYQGAGIAATEAELRWQFHPRWSVLGFAGTGITWPGDAPLRDVDTTVTGGLGLRYLVARRHGLHVGLDLAMGEEGPAVYIQFGSGWFRP